MDTTELLIFYFSLWLEKWKWATTCVFLPGESVDARSLVGAAIYGLTESDTLKQPVVVAYKTIYILALFISRATEWSSDTPDK